MLTERAEGEPRNWPKTRCAADGSPCLRGLWILLGAGILAAGCTGGDDSGAGRSGRNRASGGAQDPPLARTAGPIDDPAELAFEVVDANGRPIPARLTFTPAAGAATSDPTADSTADSTADATPDLFPATDALPHDLAVRRNTVACLSGRGHVTVPPGRYDITFSRGIEWSTVTFDDTELEPGRTKRILAELRHELDTTGWISGDFHLHTLTYSGHGDSNLRERIITLAAEGLEFAVATDHNHHTDYAPTVRELGAERYMSTVVGNEVSVPIGHFNAFPLDPEREPPASDHDDARELFRILRAEPNRFGIVPVIQVNHPRWGEIDYFGRARLDPVTATSDADTWSDDFDSVEILNENEGWGYHDAEAPGGPPAETSSSRHSALLDWFRLLNRGHRYTAVGNSDSHTVHSDFAAYPRNFVRSPTDDPASIRVEDVARAIRAGEVFPSFGPFVEISVLGVGMGGEVSLPAALPSDPSDPSAARTVPLEVRVRAASWIDCDRVKIVRNGDLVETLDVPDSRRPVRLDTRVEVPVEGDSWITVLVEGDDSLAPVVPDDERPIRPFAVANPIRVDVDGDGAYTSPWARAVRAVAAARTSGDAWPNDGAPGPLGPAERALRVTAASDRRPDLAGALAGRGLADADRGVRLASLRAIEAMARDGGANRGENRDLASAAARAFDDANRTGDAWLAAAALRALAASDPGVAQAGWLAFFEAHGEAAVARYRDELAPLAGGRVAREWRVAAWFDHPEPRAFLETRYPPEADRSATAKFRGKSGRTVRWARRETRADGYLDLVDRDRPARSRNAVAVAETEIVSPDGRTVLFAFGSDDGARLSIEGQALVEAPVRRGANPWQHVGRATLRPGANRVCVVVENGGGDFGLYFRVLDDEVELRAPSPDELTNER